MSYNFSGTTHTFTGTVQHDDGSGNTKSLFSSVENYNGSDATGSDGDSNRELTTTLTPLAIFVDGAFVHLTTDYTISSKTITFLNPLYDASDVAVIVQ